MHRFHPASGALAHWEFHRDVGSFAPVPDGSFVVALRDGIWRFDPASDARSQLAAAPYDMTEERFNDGKSDPRALLGRLDRRAASARPRRPLVLRDGILERRQSGITISNGLAWSPDGRTMYWADTQAHTVCAFDFEPLSGAHDRPARVRAVRAAAEAGGRPATAAGPTAPRSTPRAATGSRCTKARACCACRPPASCSPR